ncbi:MarR family transcriptional regulator [Candidatus Pacearchaeota archaeon]|nr:MarR family transcriptional regulator [Candidatus Pacearchaeota archaeon]
MVTKWNLIGKINSSSYRKSILTSLSGGHKTPTEMSRATSIRIYHISTILNELVKMGLIKCLNPELRKGRIYALTQKGVRILKEIKPI